MTTYLLPFLLGFGAVVYVHRLLRIGAAPAPEPRRHQVPVDVLARPELPTMATGHATDVLAAHTAALLVGDPRFDEAEHIEATHYLLTEQWLDAGATIDVCRARLDRPHEHFIDRVMLDGGRSLVTHGITWTDEDGER